MKHIRLLIPVFVFLFPVSMVAQNISMEQTLTYINNKLAGHYVLNVDRGQLIMKVYENDTLLREDFVYIDDLSVDVDYIKEENAFVMRCDKGMKDCILRKLPQKGTKNYYARINIIYDGDDKQKKGLKNALYHMLRLVKERKYKSDEPFE